ncbi:asparagine synthetase A [Mycoplasmopsis agalactiae]|uniref:asparagine synthetase A n=1 Tax=Mycoplasmopsis agalactiae TaxID=2110 RepID=UPI00211C9D24|nr:asparagine synthetase A [Mycoplasmopsis agalactiae]UUM25452.1 asparagine synthetase A [Mycoplasmopsis agalactiae]
MHSGKTNFDKYSSDFIRTISAERYGMLVKLYSEINYLTFRWMKHNNIQIVSLPITTQSISSPMGLGSDSKPYKVISKSNPDFEFFLADSMQFYLELLLRAQSIEKVGYIANTFRGEDVDNRHLHQFNHFEIEIKGNIKDCRNLVIRYLKYIVRNLIKTIPDILNYFNANNKIRLESWLKKRQFLLTHTKAVKILENDEYNNGIEIIDGFKTINSNGEKYLMNKFSNSILWLINFPSIIVPFYQKSYRGTAYNSDLLIGIGETVGAGERCETYNETIESINKHKNNTDDYKWYLDMKRLIPLKTSGFGIGLERLVLFLIDESDIRNVQLIPRETDKEILP